MTIDLSPTAAAARDAVRLLHAPADTPAPMLDEIRDALAADIGKRARLTTLSNGFPICRVLRDDPLAYELGMQLVAAYLEEHPEIEIAGTHVLHEVDTLD